MDEVMLHCGLLVAKMLKQEGVEVVFTLSGGHIAAIYDGCVREGIRVMDTRHEQVAVHAAEGWAKVTRTPGVRVTFAQPSAAWTATCSWRVSTTRMPSRTQPS